MTHSPWDIGRAWGPSASSAYRQGACYWTAATLGASAWTWGQGAPTPPPTRPLDCAPGTCCWSTRPGCSTRNGQKIWRAHYRTPAGAQRNKSSARKIDAERFLATVESAKLTGTYVDPQLAKVTVGAWADQWLANQAHLKPFTHQRYDGHHPQTHPPRNGLGKARSRFRTPRSRLGSPPCPRASLRRSVAKIHRVLSMVLDMAVKDGRLSRNVAAGVNLPRVGKSEHLYLTHDQVDDLALRLWIPGQPRQARQLRHPHQRDIPASWSSSSPTPVSGSERWPPFASTRIDLTRRRAAIVAYVTPVQGQGLVWGTPKHTNVARSPFPRSSSPNCGLTSPASGRTTSCSPGSAVVRLSGSAPSVSPSTMPPEPSASRDYIPTN